MMEKRLDTNRRQAKQFIKYSKSPSLYKCTFYCYSCGKYSCTGMPTFNEIIGNTLDKQITYEQSFICLLVSILFTPI